MVTVTLEYLDENRQLVRYSRLYETTDPIIEIIKLMDDLE